MGTFNNNKLRTIEAKKLAIYVTTFLTLIISISVISLLIVEGISLSSILLILTFVIINVIILLKNYPYFKNKMEFRNIDKRIFLISLAFLNYLDFPGSEKEKILYNLFSVHFKSDISKFFNSYKNKEINYRGICKNLSMSKPEIRYFVIYTLLDIVSSDKFYSIKEEKFIEEVRILLNIHKKSFDKIKLVYNKQGLKEERKIYEDETRRKTTKEISKSFLPYEAYKILGVSQSIKKSQLKKVYRNLAKKYHPDKFYGQNDTIIQEMENKFQEITEAYEVVKKHKRF